VPDGPCLHSLVQFLYLDDVQQQAELTPQLHVVALACNLQRLVDLCEAHFAQQLELQLLSWQGEAGLLGTRQPAILSAYCTACVAGLDGGCCGSSGVADAQLTEVC
jgi:hypothetical protein